MATTTHAHAHGLDCDGDCDDWRDTPRCPGHGTEHAWTHEGMGGCTENPGIWSLGGTTYQERRRCERCGVVETTTVYGTQRNPGQCDRREYEQPDDDQAWGEVAS